MKKFFSIILLLICLSCSKEEEAALPLEGPVIVIAEGFIFATPDITAQPGDTIIVDNEDNNPHTITSESAPGAFDDTGTFDVLVPSDGTNTFTIPDTAVAGDVFYFYCRFFEGSMTPVDGTITVE
ncbi:hypothetical protein K1X76_12075 [bacterium]|nr:hypothetical protein [bacterium]